jgi:hypothetical protein
MAFFMCDEQPAISFCDIEDFAEVISCMAVVLFSPSGIFITAASALANPSSVQAEAFDLASAGEAARRIVAVKAATNDFEIIAFTPKGVIADLENALQEIKVPDEVRAGLANLNRSISGISA